MTNEPKYAHLVRKAQALLQVDEETIIFAALTQYIRHIFGEKAHRVLAGDQDPPSAPRAVKRAGKPSNGLNMVTVRDITQVSGDTVQMTVKLEDKGLEYTMRVPITQEAWPGILRQINQSVGREIRTIQDAIGVQIPLVFASGLPVKLQSGERISSYLIRNDLNSNITGL